MLLILVICFLIGILERNYSFEQKIRLLCFNILDEAPPPPFSILAVKIHITEISTQYHLDLAHIYFKTQDCILCA